MSILGKISKIITGKNKKKRVVDGVVINFSYSGKFVFINPFDLINDFYFFRDLNLGDLSDNSQLVPYNISLVGFPEFPINPNMQVAFKLGIESCKILRFVKNEDSVSHSRYDIYHRGTPVASLIRSTILGRVLKLYQIP